MRDTAVIRLECSRLLVGFSGIRETALGGHPKDTKLVDFVFAQTPQESVGHRP